MGTASSLLEEALKEKGLQLTDETIFIQHGILKDIPIKLTVTVPEDIVLINPFMMAKILNKIHDENMYIDIIKKKDENVVR